MHRSDDNENPGKEDHSHRSRGGSSHRRRRKPTRGYVIPLDYDASAVGKSGRRRRRRRSRIGGLEVFVGLSTLWTVLVAGAVLLEAMSGHTWFFVERSMPAEPLPEVTLPGVEPGPLQDLLAPEESGADAQVLVSGGLGGEPTILWVRVFAVLLSVPLAYVLWRLARRLRRGGT